MSNFKKGDIVEGQITGITKYGVFVSLEDNYVGMVHISEVSNKFVSDLKEKFNIGNIVKVKVLEIDEDKLQVKLSIKKINNSVRKRKMINETGSGFEILKENLQNWVDTRVRELEKK